MFTIAYRLPSGRVAYHRAEGEALTAFLRKLETERVQYWFAEPKTLLKV